jgi:hypothetical protein
MVKVVFTLTVHLFYLQVLGAAIRVMQRYDDVRRLPVLTILTPGALLGYRHIPDVQFFLIESLLTSFMVIHKLLGTVTISHINAALSTE